MRLRQHLLSQAGPLDGRSDRPGKWPRQTGRV